MKFALLVTLPLVLAVALLPALMANGDPPSMTTCNAYGGPIPVILETIRTVESGGDYTAQARGSSASGAYQILDSTWDGFADYRRAADAPPEVQDAKATEMVAAILSRHEGNAHTVPVVWYLGQLPAADSAAWDRIPRPDAGNRLTPRQYQSRWIEVYDRLSAQSPGAGSAPSAAPPAPFSCLVGSTSTIDGEWALPGPRELIEAKPGALTDPHHDYPAWDWIIPIDTPIYAVRAGSVVSIRNWPLNWWAEGCGRSKPGCDTCGVGATLQDVDGNRWTYCHGTSLTVSVGEMVPAGQQVMWSGNSGRSGTPHLHIEIRTTSGVRICPQPIIVAIASGQPPSAVSRAAVTNCSFEASSN